MDRDRDQPAEHEGAHQRRGTQERELKDPVYQGQDQGAGLDLLKPED